MAKYNTVIWEKLARHTNAGHVATNKQILLINLLIDN